MNLFDDYTRALNALKAQLREREGSRVRVAKVTAVAGGKVTIQYADGGVTTPQFKVAGTYAVGDLVLVHVEGTRAIIGGRLG